jgi:hexosaminidase
VAAFPTTIHHHLRIHGQLLLMAATLIGCSPPADETPVADLPLIPRPNSVTGTTAESHLTSGTRIVAESELAAEGELLAAVLRRSTGYPIPVVTEGPTQDDIVLAIDASLLHLGDEGYRVEVGVEAVQIVAPTPAGVFYGCQTLRQLLPPAIESPTEVTGVDWPLPQVTIEDRPRFGWRGVMLDVARHFFSVDEVKGLIDSAAHYKLNRFHLHLTDDQGWRIEIQSWPELALIGGASEVGGGEGGYYTQADYADIVSYAAARHVTVVPEIDMPGHCNAALASYGELNESGVPADPYTGAEVGFSALWLDGEHTLPFVADVLGELAALTPGEYLHIGGDEAFQTTDEDYAAFIAQVQAIVGEQGKTMIGWEEIGKAPLTSPVVAQWWRDEALVGAAAAQGAVVIASPATHAYLDMIYDLDSHVGTMWAGATSVEDGYSWDPLDAGLADGQLMGVEAPLWTETVDLLEDVEFLVFPRLLGHAEIGWSDREGRSWDEYRDRLAHHGQRLDRWGVNFYRSPEVDWEE